MSGKVWLVGSGPGDVGLFTLRGKEVLSRAEVVVYDALVGQGVLNLIPEEAELINVGKRARHHIRSQWEINDILLEKAQEGKRVVRLKGGDPFLFGRGGEELEKLVRAGIDFEIVPGVTSAIAVPAYNGIPVTHRDFTQSLHIITGHRREGMALDTDFASLVKTGGTLVFLMGLASLPDIVSGLMEAGMDGEMPSAVLQQGTTARQRRVVAPLKDLEREVKQQGIQTPAIIVVGKVCSLSEDFFWYEKRPLSGRKILVTRPKELISGMAGLLREAGAEVLEMPAIKTKAIMPNEALGEALREVKEKGAWDWVVFTSPTGVRIFFEYLSQAEDMDIRLLAGSCIAAIGQGTEKALRQYCLQADLKPEMADGEHLGLALREKLVPGSRVLIPRASLGNQELIDAIKDVENVEIADIPTYDTLYECSAVIDEKELFEKGEIDYAVFTSASTVRGFAAATKGLDMSKVKAVCIGRQSAAEAGKLGMQTWTAERATMESVVSKVIEVCTCEKRA